MSKLRLSYTLLMLWDKGEKEKAAETYLHMDSFMTSRMKEGKAFDQYVAEVVTKEGKLPDELGGEKLPEGSAPHYQVTVPYKVGEIEVDVKAEFDVWAKPTIIEIKNSVNSDSAEWTNTPQLSMYFFVAEVAKLGAKKAVLYRFDPIHHTYDRAVVWKSDRRIQEAKTLIEKYAIEIYEYFSKEGIL